MHLRYRGALAALACASLLSCTGTDHVAGPAAAGDTATTSQIALTPACLTLPSVRISEIHYDNTGTDAGEAIEISGPAGAVLTGVSVVLYNGDGGVSYNTQTLSGTMPATCSDRGVVVIADPRIVTKRYGRLFLDALPDGAAIEDSEDLRSLDIGLMFYVPQVIGEVHPDCPELDGFIFGRKQKIRFNEISLCGWAWIFLGKKTMITTFWPRLTIFFMNLLVCAEILINTIKY